MQQEQKDKLFEIVFQAILDNGLKRSIEVIQDAHMGRPMSFINNDNMHLFRTYRNHVSVDATALAYDAIRHETDEESWTFLATEYAGS